MKLFLEGCQPCETTNLQLPRLQRFTAETQSVNTETANCHILKCTYILSLSPLDTQKLQAEQAHPANAKLGLDAVPAMQATNFFPVLKAATH